MALWSLLSAEPSRTALISEPPPGVVTSISCRPCSAPASRYTTAISTDSSPRQLRGRHDPEGWRFASTISLWLRSVSGLAWGREQCRPATLLRPWNNCRSDGEDDSASYWRVIRLNWASADAPLAAFGTSPAST